MAHGPTAPPPGPARPVRPLPTPRPGAALTAAAAVPLGAAVLYASGWLAWGPRLALGIAVVVLGNALRGTVDTVTGARIGAAVARTVGVVAIVGGVLIVVAAALTGLGIERAPAGGSANWEVSLDGVMLLVGVPTVGLVVAALAGLGLRTPSAVRGAQQVATAGAVVVALGVLILGQQAARSAARGGGPAYDGLAAAGGVLLLTLLLLGSALLAATTARRTSRPAAIGSIVGTVAAALWAATLSVITADGLDPVRDDTAAATLLRPLDLLLGFGGPGRLLDAAAPGWPVAFGLVGVTLLGAAVWLESRRPLPADAPLASRRGR